MENEETVKMIEAPARRSRVWIVALTFIALLAGLAAAVVIVRRAPSGQSAAVPSPTQTAEPQLTPEPDPEQTPPPQTVTVPPETEPPKPAYSKTAIVVEGKTGAVVASYEAAEELLRHARMFFEDKGTLPDNAVTELAVNVELRAAGEDEEPLSYDAAFDLLTGENTPLVYVSRATYIEDTPIAHSNRVIPDSMLPKGIRVVKIYGRDGVQRRIFEMTYKNGVQQYSRVTETFTVMEPVNGDIRIGMRVFPAGYTVGPNYGSNPDAAIPLSMTVPVHGTVTSLYGPFEGGFHHGIDISVPPGTTVRAACDGTVVSVMERGSYGLMIEISHENGVTTRYAKLGEATVAIGDTVSAGDVIGTVGGDEYTSHLHFELRIQGTAYNPLKKLPLIGFNG